MTIIVDYSLGNVKGLKYIIPLSIYNRRFVAGTAAGCNLMPVCFLVQMVDFYFHFISLF